MTPSLLRDWSESAPSPIANAAAEAAAEGRRVVDLITANPQEHGLAFPSAALDAAIAAAAREATVRRYAPDPKGQRAARKAIATYYFHRGEQAHPDSLILTPGTSFGYLCALRLLTQPGDNILLPKPGYPLLDDLCAILGLQKRHYHLGLKNGAWVMDAAEVEFQMTARTRAVVVVSPHNPTGHIASDAELMALASVCRNAGAALVFDEVFSEHMPPGAHLPRPSGRHFPLAVSLNGISKMMSLPEWKIAWMRIDGDEAGAGQFARAAEHFCDAFLPVNELAQAMLPDLFRAAEDGFFASLADAYAERRAAAAGLLPPGTPQPAAGMYVCPQVPRGIDEKDFVLRNIRERGLMVHPGYYYDMPGHFVASLAPAPEVLRDALPKLLLA